MTAADSVLQSPGHDAPLMGWHVEELKDDEFLFFCFFFCLIHFADICSTAGPFCKYSFVPVYYVCCRKTIYIYQHQKVTTALPRLTSRIHFILSRGHDMRVKSHNGHSSTFCALWLETGLELSVPLPWTACSSAAGTEEGLPNQRELRRCRTHCTDFFGCFF